MMGLCLGMCTSRHGVESTYASTAVAVAHLHLCSKCAFHSSRYVQPSASRPHHNNTSKHSAMRTHISTSLPTFSPACTHSQAILRNGSFVGTRHNRSIWFAALYTVRVSVSTNATSPAPTYSRTTHHDKGKRGGQECCTASTSGTATHK